MLKNLRNIFRKKTDYNSLPHIDCQEDAYAILYNMPLKQDKTFMTFTSTNTYEELKKMQMMDESLEADGLNCSLPLQKCDGNTGLFKVGVGNP